MRAPGPELLLLIGATLLTGCDGRALPGTEDADAPGTGDAWRTPDAWRIPDAGQSLDLAPIVPGPDLAFHPDPWAKCAPGQRMWCDGPVYDGWGLVECDPATGHWKTTVVNGKTTIDCREDLAAGTRPNTLCACYHLFTNFSCCERPDCILEPGESGQICPPSPGKLCDYCNPLQPECVETDAKCVTTNSHESFCARLCSAAAPCPSGYVCMTIKLKQGSTQQCVPSDFSCYY